MSSASEKDAEGEGIDGARADAVPVSSDKDTDDPPLLPTTDAMPKSPPVELPSRIVGEYEVLSPLGSGGMGEVFKARHRRLNKLVALKLPVEERNGATGCGVSRQWRRFGRRIGWRQSARQGSQSDGQATGVGLSTMAAQNQERGDGASFRFRRRVAAETLSACDGA